MTMSIKKKLFTFLVCLPFTANAQWVQLNSPGDEYIIMSVVNKDTLVYSNDSDGKIYHTFNGGETWSDFQNVISNIWINDFDFVTDQVGYACGGSYNETNNKVIFKTPNAGLTWDTVSVSPASFLDSGSLHGIDFLNSDTGFVCSDSRLFRTIDR